MHNDRIQELTLSHDGRLIATASWDGWAKILRANGELMTSINYGSPVNSIGFSPDGRRIAIGGYPDDKGEFWAIYSTDGRKLLGPIRGHTDQISKIAFSPDRAMVASASWGRSIKLWNSKTGKLIRTLSGHSNWIYGLAFNPKKPLIASSGKDGSLRIWSLSGKVLLALVGHDEKPIRDVEFSPDGNLLAGAAEDGTVQIWDLHGKLLKTVKGHSDQIWGINFSQDGSRITSASWDGSIKIWNTKILAGGELLKSGCKLLDDYIKNNATVIPSDKSLCRMK